MKIGILITTFLRDELLYKSIQSIADNWQDNFELIIVDQGEMDTNKHKWILDKNLNSCYYSVPFNSGLSYCRNFGVQKAKELGCEYVFIGSDSFLFNKSLQNINTITDLIEISDYDLIGFELANSICGWEAKLNLIEGESFELDFINKQDIMSEYFNLPDNRPIILQCDIVRNFFIAKTESLLNVKWDENLLLGEHEDFFWQYKQAGYKCGWTDYISATKLTDRPPEYAKFRKQNFKEGIKKLREKYNINGWVTYKHLERAKNGQL